jgi:hypothetical protein
VRIPGLSISCYPSSSLPEDISKQFLFSSFSFLYNFSLHSFASKLLVGNHFWQFCHMFVIMGKSLTFLSQLAYILLSEILNEIYFCELVARHTGNVQDFVASMRI